MGSRLLSVDTTSVQTCLERFPSGDRFSVAPGRNNLTALSQDVDLYFIAEFDQILVFRPHFPTQKLGELLYRWLLPASKPNLPGYIDRSHPHAVNSLLVAWLGIFEVLVCACDDGDVIMYYLHEIQESMEETSVFSESIPRPLMISNVGRSAWGLAVHTNARKLAVSCNTHKVTVYSYALTDDSALYNNPDEWQYPGRARDDCISLDAHRHNIPNVAFYNSDRDKEGRWLVSTDLTGMIVLWDLRDRCEKRRINPYKSSIHPNPHSGWSVSCIDPQAFLLAGSWYEYLGCEVIQDDIRDTYDITAGRQTLRNSTFDEELSVDSQRAYDMEETESDDEHIQHISTIDASPTSSDSSFDPTRDVSEDSHTGTPSRHPGSPKIPPEDLYASFLLIHTGQDFVTMQKAPFVDLAIVSRDPCHQHFAANTSWLISHDRLHLTQVITELNLFIAATAAGRVAIYALTRKISNVADDGSTRDEYGLRLEHVLPLHEHRAERSAYLLIGLATARVQNTSLTTRWRLTLTYHDHTIINYELYRPQRSSEGFIGATSSNGNDCKNIPMCRPHTTYETLFELLESQQSRENISRAMETSNSAGQ